MIPAGLCLLLSGCLFDQVRRSEEDDIRRVEGKQASLRAEEDRSARLRRQEAQLAAELGEREFSLNELNDRLQQINTENGRVIADNDASRLEYRQLLGQLRETNEELTLARQAGSDETDERRARIASLKARIKTQLDILFR